jgi:hypothetical protein
MGTMRHEQKRFQVLGSFVVAFVSLCTGMILVAMLQVPIRANQGANVPEKAPVPKSKEPIDIDAAVVAMSRDPWQNYGWSLYLLLFRVDKVVGGKETAQYVRGDFPDISVYTDSEEARVYRQLIHSLREPKTWKIHLRPPRGSPECYTVSPPIPGDIASGANPVMLPVGGASGYPDINTVPCYVFDQRDIQEITSPEKPKSVRSK